MGCVCLCVCVCVCVCECSRGEMCVKPCNGKSMTNKCESLKEGQWMIPARADPGEAEV